MEETKTYIEYSYPGALFSEYETKVVKSRSPKTHKIPEGAFAFQYFDQTSKTVKVGGEPQVVFGKRKNVSKTYYPDGKLYTIDDLKKDDSGDFSILISNMKCNDWPVVIRTRRGNYQPFDEKKDELL